MTFNKLKKIALFCSLLFLLSFSFVFAQRTQLQYPQFPGIPAFTGALPDFFRYLYQIFLGIGVILAFSFFVYGGLLYLISFGNPSRLSKAKDLMISALLGLFILFASYAILSTIDPSLVIFGVQISSFRVPQVSLQLPPTPGISPGCREVPLQKTFEAIQDLGKESLEIAEKIKDSIYDPSDQNIILGGITKEIGDLISQCQCEKFSSECLEPASGAWKCPSQCSPGQDPCPPELKQDLIPQLENKLNNAKELIDTLNEKIRRLTELRLDFDKYLNEVSQCRQDKMKELFICPQAKWSGFIAGCKELDFYCCQ